jgi:hypothetical protein
MMTPVPPRSKSPLTQLTISPRTCVAMIPSPKAASEPSDSCRGEGRAEQQKENPNHTAQRRELLVRYRIEGPETIEGRASPEQCSCGEARHNGTKEQENAYRSESWRLSSDSEIEPGAIVVPHQLNISQLRKPRSACWRKIANCTQFSRDRSPDSHFAVGRDCHTLTRIEMRMVLDPKTQNMAERCEPKVFGPRGEERVPLKLLLCLTSMDFSKSCCRKHLGGTEM